MDPEFQRALITVVIVGSVIALIGTVVLYFAFQAFGGKKPGGQLHAALIAGLLAFIFLCSFALFYVSWVLDR